MDINASCLSNTHSELKGRIDLVKPVIIGITEVWQKGEIAIQGYPFKVKDRNDRVGGGVMVRVKDCWDLTRAPTGGGRISAPLRFFVDGFKTLSR